MEIMIYTPHLEVIYQDGIILLNYLIEQVLEITARIKI